MAASGVGRVSTRGGAIKIIEIKPVLAFGERQTWVFVLVETDAGIAGVGEASLEGKERAVQAAVDDLARFIVFDGGIQR